MNRIISLSVEDMYIKYTGEAFGATGSHNAVTLRMAFGPAWEGTAKTAYFTDALGNTSVALVLGLDTLVDGAYEVDVPSEALKTAGVATITIKGVLVSGKTTTKAITTAAGHFRVLDSELPDSAGNAGECCDGDRTGQRSGCECRKSGSVPEGGAGSRDQCKGQRESGSRIADRRGDCGCKCAGQCGSSGKERTDGAGRFQHSHKCGEFCRSVGHGGIRLRVSGAGQRSGGGKECSQCRRYQQNRPKLGCRRHRHPPRRGHGQRQILGRAGTGSCRR